MLWNRWFIRIGRFLLKEILVKINNSLCWNSNIWLSIKVIARQCKVRGWSSANAGHHPLPQWPQNAPNIAMGPWGPWLLPWNRRVELLPNQSGEAAGCSGPKNRRWCFHDMIQDMTSLSYTVSPIARSGSYDVKCGRDTASLLAVMRSS